MPAKVDEIAAVVVVVAVDMWVKSFHYPHIHSLAAGFIRGTDPQNEWPTG